MAPLQLVATMNENKSLSRNSKVGKIVSVSGNMGSNNSPLHTPQLHFNVSSQSNAGGNDNDLNVL